MKNTGEKNEPLLLAARLSVHDGLCVQVWFRRGVNSFNPCGSGWISIGGEMLMVDVGLNDQVLLMLFLFNREDWEFQNICNIEQIFRTFVRKSVRC